jgi:hypothetical protein
MTGGQAGATTAPGRMSEAEFRSLHGRLRAQLPWGPDDRRGALNYITPADVLAACGAVRLGRTVPLAAPVEDSVTPDNPDPARHQMKRPLGADAGPGLSFSLDRIAMNIHGNADSHLDALCHVIFDAKLYNGVPAETVTETGSAGATSCSCGWVTAAGGTNGVRGTPPSPGPGCIPPCSRCWRSVRSAPWAATGTTTPRPVPSMASTSPSTCSPSTPSACT